MTDSLIDAVPEMGGADQHAAGDPLDSAVIAAIKSAVLESTSGLTESYAKKEKAMNHELASMRRKMKRGPEADAALELAEASNGNGRDVHADQLTRDDVSALIKVGSLRSQVSSSATVDAIQGLDLSPSQEAAILEAILAGAPNQPASQGRDAREIKRTATSAIRNSVPLPRSQREYLDLRKSDPKRYAALDADPAFDPTDLPYRV